MSVGEVRPLELIEIRAGLDPAVTSPSSGFVSPAVSCLYGV